MTKRSISNKIYKPYIHKRISANFIDSLVIIIFLFLSLTCLMVNNYSREMTKQVNLTQFANSDNRVVTVMTNHYSTEIDSSNVSSISKIWNCNAYNYFNESDFGNFQLGNDRKIAVKALSVGIVNNKMTLPSFCQTGATERVSIIEGSLPIFSDNTEDEYVCLHKSTRDIIFGKNAEVIGKKIEFYYNYTYHVYKIAAVLSDSYDVIQNLSGINHVLSSSGDVYFMDIYLPIIHVAKKLDTISKVLLFFDNNISTSTIKKMEEYLATTSYNQLTITSALERLEYKEEQLTSLNTIINIILNTATIVLSGISILLIFIFIKKRKIEIGIRKSLGATALDLITMFLSEIIYCFVIATLYAIPISFFIMLFNSLKIKPNIYAFVFPVNFSIFAIPICIIFLIIMSSSLLFIIFFSKRKISTCLKEK